VDYEPLIRIGLATAVGGAIGAEREFRDRSAGFRTLIFICVGSALFTIFSERIGISRDTARIAAQVVSGVGFLGGGAILREGANVRGLTTAATIWLTAALGMGLGAGYIQISLVASAIVLVVLWFFPAIEGWIDNLRVSRTYEVVLAQEGLPELIVIFEKSGLRAKHEKRLKKGSDFVCSWYVEGGPDKHGVLLDAVQNHVSVKEVRF
jgi:putative Mg2+ transporter-C (MgtC) family protein